MATSFRKSCIGIEFTLEHAIFSELEIDNQTIVVKRQHMVTLPPNTFRHHEIADVETFSQMLLRILEEADFRSPNLIVGLNDLSFLKRMDKLSMLAHQELAMELELKLSSSYLYANNDFEMGFQTDFKLDIPKKNYQSVLSAAIRSTTVDSFINMAELMGKNLVTVDIVPLAIVRAVSWYSDTFQPVTAILFVDQDYSDFTIMYNNVVVFSQTIRKTLEELTDPGLGIETVLKTLNYYFMNYTNLYPEYPAPTQMIMVSKHEKSTVMFDAIQESFETISCVRYNPEAHFKYDVHLVSAERPGNVFNHYLASMGLALKFFEPSNQTLSLTKLRRHLDPIFNKIQVSISAGILVAMMLIYFGGSLYITNSVSTVGERLAETRKSIKSLQSGEYLLHQKRLVQYQELLGRLKSIRKQDKSKVAFFQTITKNLPEDLTYRIVRIYDKGKVSIKGNAVYQDSIHEFYNHLKQYYGDVTLTSIKTKYDHNGVPNNMFEVYFYWR